MDVGKIAGKESSYVWKIGITKKGIVGNSAKEARYHGKVGEHVRVIRQKLFRDGRDAYMIEQTMVGISNQESFFHRQKNWRA